MCMRSTIRINPRVAVFITNSKIMSKPVFTVLRVKAFSGYYPSCSQCLKRVTIVPVSSITPRRPRYECRSCREVYQEEELEYRYCVTLAAQAAHNCKEVVIFGESLNPVFGVTATHLRRFLEPNRAPMMSPLDLFSVLSEPLQTVLAGRCFTAALAKPPTHVQPRQNWDSADCRYVATEFNLLGHGVLHVTVISLLSKQLSLFGPLGCDPEKNTLEESHNQFDMSQKSSGLDSSYSVSILSSASTSETCHVHLDQVSGGSISTHTYTACYDDTLPDSESFLEEFQCNFEQSTELTTSNTSTPPHTQNLSQLVEHSTTNRFHRWPSRLPLRSSPMESISRSISPHTLQCTPPDLSVHVHAPHFTPELFSESVARFSSERLSPELFSSPSSDTSSVRLCHSAAVDVVENTYDVMYTPAVGERIGSAPKKRLLEGGALSAMQAHYVQPLYKNTHTPLSQNDAASANCFTPELFP